MMGRVFGGENFGGEGGPVDWMPSDKHLIEEINTKFTHHPVLDGNSIVVTSQEGIVGLRGFVRSHEAKALAEGLAQSVSGVRSVHNDIEVKGGNVS
jgi:osmotically-inducible protein OsmY